MTPNKTLHTNGGDGQLSYAQNSGLQRVVITKTLSLLDATLKDMFALSIDGFPKRMKIADLGCSSGLNTIFLVSHILDTVEDLSKHDGLKNSPEFEVFLNDLPDNDFNNLFKLTSNFCRESKMFVYGAPGSFYSTLFPSNTIHFAYSSYSLHWLCQIPDGVGKENKESICVAPNSPPHVCEAYAKRFQRDFSRFLSLRAEEIASAGRMVLAFIGRSATDPSTDEPNTITIIGETLSDMVALGLITKDDLHSFNMPFYFPCLEEIETIIRDEGSFDLDMMEVVRVPWDAHGNYDDNVFDKYKSAELVADCLRAVTEPMLNVHFGNSIADRVFDIYANKIAEHLSKERSCFFTPVISLTKKPQ